ncbi:MAG: hypothetical protein WBB18_05630 [Nodosilinea sp.]
MADPLFWLALSFLLVVVSLTAVLMVAIPALRELGRASRSAEKFFDTLGRELPPTLEAIRLTSLEITELTDDVTEGVQGAGQVVQQVNQSITTAQTGAQRLNTGTKSVLAGTRAAWRTLTGSPPPPLQSNTATPPPLPSAPRPGLSPNADSAYLDPGTDGSEKNGDRGLADSNPVPLRAGSPAPGQESLKESRLDQPSIETSDLPPR